MKKTIYSTPVTQRVQFESTYILNAGSPTVLDIGGNASNLGATPIAE